MYGLAPQAIDVADRAGADKVYVFEFDPGDLGRKKFVAHRLRFKTNDVLVMVYADSPDHGIERPVVRVRAFALRRALAGRGAPSRMPRRAPRCSARASRARSCVAQRACLGRSLAGRPMQSSRMRRLDVRLRLADLARHHRGHGGDPLLGGALAHLQVRVREAVVVGGEGRRRRNRSTSSTSTRPVHVLHGLIFYLRDLADLPRRISVWARPGAGGAARVRAGSCTRTATISSTATGRRATTTRATASSTPSPTSWR